MTFDEVLQALDNGADSDAKIRSLVAGHDDHPVDEAVWRSVLYFAAVLTFSSVGLRGDSSRCWASRESDMRSILDVHRKRLAERADRLDRMLSTSSAYLQKYSRCGLSSATISAAD